MNSSNRSRGLSGLIAMAAIFEDDARRRPPRITGSSSGGSNKPKRDKTRRAMARKSKRKNRN